MNKLLKSTVILMLITMLSKVIGFLRETILVSTYGAGIISDAYIISMQIPSTLFAIIATALATTFIPLFCNIDENEGKKAALKFANNIFNIVILFSVVLSIIGFVFAEPLVKLFAMDFDGEKLYLAIKFTRIMVFSMLFVGTSNMMSSWLQIKGKYNIPGLVGIPYNIIIISSILISIKYNVEILAIGTLIAILSKFIFQLPFAYKNGYRYECYINLKDEKIKKIIYLMMPVVISVGASEINTVIDATLASTLGDGIITVLSSANILNGFVTGIFISTTVSIIYPILSKLSTNNDNIKFKNMIKKSINILIIIMIPISVGAIVLSVPIVKLIFERGKFNREMTILTAQALSYYSVGIAAGGITTILNRAFYSIEDTKTPMKNSIIAIVINIVLNIVLIKFMGHRGLALATSISAIVSVILLFKRLESSIGDFGKHPILQVLKKSSIASFIMGVMTYISYILVILNTPMGLRQDLLAISIPILIGILIYIVVIANMKIIEIDEILSIIEYKIKYHNNSNK